MEEINVEHSVTLTYSETKAIIDALKARAAQYESLAANSPSPAERASLLKHATRFLSLVRKFQQDEQLLSSEPPEQQELGRSH